MTATATHPGVVTYPGTTLGMRGELEAIPLTENEVVVLDDGITVGPAYAQTDTTGTLQGGGLKVPIVTGLLWRLMFRPFDDNVGGKIDLGVYNLNTSGVPIEDLVVADFLGIDATVASNIAAAAALGATNDTATASYFANTASASRVAADKLYRRDVSVTDPTYGADPTGVADSSTAFANAIATGRPVYVPAGTYKVTPPFALTTTNQRVTLAGDATLMLPSGYAGDVWRFGGGATILTGIIVEGGTVKETGKSGGAATTPGAWTLARFKGAGTGTSACEIRDQTVYWPGTAFMFETTGTGWANGNRVTKMQVYYPAVMLDCNRNGGSQTAFSNNAVRDILGQSGNYTTYGIKGLTGYGWRLDNVALWDIGINNPSGISGEILSTARGTVITGGQVTIWNYTDAATDTLVMDSKQRVTIGGVVPTLVTPKVKTADTSRVNPTDALAADPELTIPLVPVHTYRVELLLYYIASTVGDITVGWTAPTGAVMTWAATGLRTAAGSASDTVMHNTTSLAGTLVLGGAGAGIQVAARLSGVLVASGTAGSLSFRWTQATADATTPTVVGLRSLLTITPLD